MSRPSDRDDSEQQPRQKLESVIANESAGTASVKYSSRTVMGQLVVFWNVGMDVSLHMAVNHDSVMSGGLLQPRMAADYREIVYAANNGTAARESVKIFGCNGPFKDKAIVTCSATATEAFLTEEKLRLLPRWSTAPATKHSEHPY